MTREENDVTDFEDYLRRLQTQAGLWAEKAATMPLILSGMVWREDMPDKVLGQLGVMRAFIEETFIKNRVELSEAVRKLDDTEKLLRQQIDRDVSRIRESLRSLLGR